MINIYIYIYIYIYSLHTDTACRQIMNIVLLPGTLVQVHMVKLCMKYCSCEIFGSWDYEFLNQTFLL